MDHLFHPSCLCLLEHESTYWSELVIADQLVTIADQMQLCLHSEVNIWFKFSRSELIENPKV